MTIHFVEELDNILLRDIRQYQFLETTLLQQIKSKDMKISIFNYKNTTSEKRKKKLKQFFVTIGISEDFYDEDGERFLNEVINLKEEEFINRAND